MQLRPRQKKAVEALYENYLNYKRPAIICATGGFGKSVVQAKFAELLGDNVRILQVADRKELLQQNEKKYHSSCKVGVVSTGLERKEFDRQIVIGGIQTVYNKTSLLGEIDVIIIDECDLYDGVGGGMYYELIKAYPKAKVFGLSGTPWREGEGKLVWGDIIFKVTYKEELEDGYLSPITNKICFKPDLSQVKKIGGDYSEKSLKEQYLDKTNICDWVEKLEPYRDKRKKWLVFLPSVEYANQFAFALGGIRVLARAVTSETKERDKYIDEFRNGEIQALVGVGVFERGFDVPDVDLIVDLSPTKSLKKWLQRIWRGVRIAENKKDCWYLDFANNLKEHGSIHNQDWLLENGEIKIKKKYVEKICPACETFIPAFAKTCPHCLYDFIQDEIRKKASLNADTESDINSEWEAKPKYNWYYVSNIIYEPNWISSKKKKCFRVIYECGPKFKMYEYLYGAKKVTWLLKRGWIYGTPIDFKKLKEPVKIAVGKQVSNPQFNEIKEFGWSDINNEN